MMMCPRAADQDAPLFDWPERHEIERLEDQRQQLHGRIMALRPHSHYRIELEARLRELTRRQLDLQQLLEKESRS